MKKYIEELMADYPDDPPRGTQAAQEQSTSPDGMTQVGREGRAEAKESLDVGAGNGAPGKGTISPTDHAVASTVEPTSTLPAAETEAAAGIAPASANEQVSLSGGSRLPYFYNQSGQFSSGNQSLQGLKTLGELGLNPNSSTFQKAIAGVQRYENGGGTMPLDASGNFVQGWKPEDYNNLIDWTKVEGIGRPIDVSKKEDRDAVQNWLGARFGAGLNNMHVDDKFGPYHVAAILEAAGQGGDNTPTPGDNTPPPPERPNDPEEPTPDPYRDRYEEYLQKGLNPLLAYIGDEPKAIDTKRLRTIMSAQALGEGLRSIADVIHGPKGAPITEHKNNVTDWSIGKIDEAVRQFNSDKKEHRQMKLNALMTAMNAARQQSNADRQDWRQSIAQMYDRFDKKVDRQDKQYKDAWDRYNTDRQFRQQADQLAASLEQQGLNRKQAKELSIMQMNHAAQMQREQFAHQKQMQDDAIKAGRYENRGSGGDGGGGKHSTVTFIHKNEKGESVESEMAVPKNISDDVNLKLAQEAQNNSKLRGDMYKLKQALQSQGVPEKEINRVILQQYIPKYYTHDGTNWVPVTGSSTGTAQPAAATQPAADDGYMVMPSQGQTQPQQQKKAVDF